MINVNQITSQLAKMADPVLQKYAAMHKNDPYTVALAVGESNRRKAMRTAAQGRAAGQQQPKVVDQDIAEMAAVDPMGNMTGALPENMGIGRLPAPNMAPIGKAEGGIIGYADRGVVQKDPNWVFTNALRGLFEREGGETVDQGGRTKYGISSRGHPNVNMDKLTLNDAAKIYKRDYWDAYGLDKLAKRNPQLAAATFDTFVNHPPAFAKRALEESGGDVNKLLDIRRGEYERLAKSDPNKNAGSLKGWNNRLTHLASSVANLPTEGGGDVSFPQTTAQAAPTTSSAPAGSVQDMMSRIPTGGVPGAGPTPAAPKDVGFLSPEDIEKKFGVSPDTARNIYTNMMAPTPLAPASQLPKTPGYVSRAVQGVAGLGEKLYNKVVPTGKISEEGVAALQAQRAAEKALEAEKATQLRLTPPSAPLTQGGPTVPVTQAGQGVVQTAEDLEKVRLANQAADRLAASQTAARTAQVAGNAPSAAEKIQTASLLREADEAARLTQAARAATNTKTGVATTQIPGGVTDLLKSTPIDMGDLEATDRSLGQVQPTPEVKKIEEAAPVSDGKTTGGGGLSSLFKDPAFLMGMRLLANKNPNLFNAVGEAGIGTVGDVAAAEKASSESEYRKSMGKYYGAYGEAIERGAKEKNEVQLAEKSAQEALDTWAKNNKMALFQSPDLYDRMRDKYRRDAYNVYGIKMPAAVAQQGAPQNDPLGILGKG
jgi:hypothetical protein